MLTCLLPRLAAHTLTSEQNLPDVTLPEHWLMTDVRGKIRLRGHESRCSLVCWPAAPPIPWHHRPGSPYAIYLNVRTSRIVGAWGKSWKRSEHSHAFVRCSVICLRPAPSTLLGFNGEREKIYTVHASEHERYDGAFCIVPAVEGRLLTEVDEYRTEWSALEWVELFV